MKQNEVERRPCKSKARRFVRKDSVVQDSDIAGVAREGRDFGGSFFHQGSHRIELTIRIPAPALEEISLKEAEETEEKDECAGILAADGAPVVPIFAADSHPQTRLAEYNSLRLASRNAAK